MATTHRDPVERRVCLRLFYRDWRPTRLGRLVSGALAWLSGLGLIAAHPHHIAGQRPAHWPPSQQGPCRRKARRTTLPGLDARRRFGLGAQHPPRKDRPRQARPRAPREAYRGPRLETRCNSKNVLPRRHERASPLPGIPHGLGPGVRCHCGALPRVPHRPGLVFARGRYCMS